MVTAGEMADGLGLAETTPGPLIMVTQYVGSIPQAALLHESLQSGACGVFWAATSGS